MPRDSCTGSSTTVMSGFFFIRAKLISRRQLWEFSDWAERKAMQTVQPLRCCAMISGHSEPGSIPSSYQMRYPSRASRSMTGNTASRSLWQ